MRCLGGRGLSGSASWTRGETGSRTGLERQPSPASLFARFGAAQTIGDGLGFDILSFDDADDWELMLDVKAAGQKQAIIEFHDKNPLEGYRRDHRRLTFMMLGWEGQASRFGPGVGWFGQRGGGHEARIAENALRGAGTPAVRRTGMVECAFTHVEECDRRTGV